MEKSRAIAVMSALAQPTRLDVFTELARAHPDGLSAGAIAQRLGTPANTMSAHLAILSRAGLITSTRTGRSIVYKVAPQAMVELATFLTRDCCPAPQAEMPEAVVGSSDRQP